MPETLIKVFLEVSFTGGPKVSAPQTISVDAYDVIKVSIEAGTSAAPKTRVVEVQPGEAGRVQFFMINSDKFSTDDPNEKLTYKVNDAATEIELDAPLLLVGDGAVKLLVKPPNELTFKNTLGEDVNLEISVGRKV